MIDLRSDTVTRPTQPMLEAMMAARVGDDVFGEDPTINELEAEVAKQFGKDAALFCASGTMANQIAIKCHTRPGDEVICETNSHVYIYEGGGIAFNSGCQVKPLPGVRGLINAQQVVEAINPDDIHKPVSRLVCLENSSNRGGGSIYQLSDIEDIRAICLQNNLKLHLDGARLWNALVARGETALQHGKQFDSISVCFSKGLGAPVGSVLVGNADFIHQARRVRKVYGGGMRQAGYLAAACLYALDHNVARLESDHNHAKYIASQLIKKDFVGKMLPVESNMIIFEVHGRFTPKAFVEKLAGSGIKCLAISPTQVRMVTHLDILPVMVEQLGHIIEHM
ncbi:MAG: aminotransferase class I/II-fold pyridoxal phosphate-dependent enzyme [Chitinophagaceae bacterium]|nr:aminotransferase class I/II-fold pyridoxal phosphate-dependent enzyme [Bacteroidota bacterium]MCC6257677.1 aminotransferase class I/II-fold pyridoxal phosphate-dependent enzyme [Chitinophagaceae bacterium]MCW5917452.1 aminotransferase class I/II-fold pyridoxal phosphate-dependent enzyme [Ferruginibacter sp.]